jgi:hypothetical protein
MSPRAEHEWPDSQVSTAEPTPSILKTQRSTSPTAERTPRARKAAAQREGLALLEKLLLDLAAAGQWFRAERLELLERQSRQLADAYLPQARTTLRRLVQLGRRTDLTAEQRSSMACELIGRLWATVQVGSRYLEGTLAGEEATEAEAVVEEVLGKSWQLKELRARGYFRQNLDLLELAYERFDDEVTDLRVEVSFLVGLSDGAVFRAVNYRPRKALQHTRELPSYTQPLHLSEAAVYPGFLTRRIRWAPGAERLLPPRLATLRQAHAVAQADFAKVLGDFRRQVKHPLASREAVVLLRCQLIGTLGDRVILVDAQGHRLEAAERRAGYSHVANLYRAGGELRDEPALLARLFVRPGDHAVVAQPLALLSPSKHLRLGI